MPRVPPIALRHIRVVGTSGSGKSRLAQQLSARLGLARLDLDAVFWDAHWIHRDVDEARRMVHDFVAAHPGGWVADGNWTNKLDGLLDPRTAGGADAWVWLDHPRRMIIRRAIARTVRRGITREELWHGNREDLRNLLSRSPERNIVRWAWTSHPALTARMEARIAAGDPVIRLRGQREVDAWLSSLPAARA